MLVLHEALWMDDTLHHTLVNSNQLLHYGVRVQDNPMSESPLSIITEDGDFSMELLMEGNIIFDNTHTQLMITRYDNAHILISAHHILGIQ